MDRKTKIWLWSVMGALVVLTAIGIMIPAEKERHSEESETHPSYSAFMRKAETGAFRTVTVLPRERRLLGVREDGTRSATPYTGDSGIAEALRGTGTEVVVAHGAPADTVQENDEANGTETPGFALGWLIGPLITVGLIVLILVWFSRRSSGQFREMSGFAAAKVRRYDPRKERVTYDDVIGMDAAVEEMKEVRDILTDPSRAQRYGARLPKGVLLVGPPGCGKTLLARATACEAGVPFFHLSGSEFVEMFVGVGAARVRSLFEQARRSAPCVVFIDEIDALGRHRGGGLGHAHDEREQTLNQLLVEMDGVDPNSGVFVMAATNRPDILDTALTRAGRFDRRVAVSWPDLAGRIGILWHYARHLPLDDDADLDVIARMTAGCSGADLESIVNEAALIASRNAHPGVSMDDIREAFDKVRIGLPSGVILTEEEKRCTACHEAGHVLAAWFTKSADPVEKVTIVPRAQALGMTYIVPETERHQVKESMLRAWLTVAFGGRAAERIVYGECSTGARDDLAKASAIARDMVVRDGMSEKVGPVAHETDQDPVFLGRDMARKKAYSEGTAREIDLEVRRILRETEERTAALLRDRRQLLDALTDALAAAETLDRKEIEAILGAPVR